MQIKLLLTLLLLIIFLAAGCTRHHQRSPHGTKLSKAMEKASDKYEGDRTVDTETKVPDRKSFRLVLPSLPKSDASAPKKASGEKKQKNSIKVTGLNVGTGIFDRKDYYRLNHIDLSYGFCTKKRKRLERLEAFVGLGQLMVDETVDLNQSIDNAWLGSIGFRYKRYTTADHTFMGHYYILGLSFDYLHWSYENDILVDERSIGSDGLFGYELSGGMGFNLAQFPNYQLGVELLPSLALWEAHTDEGFDNDVFGAFFMLKLRFSMSHLSRPEEE